ncbi:LOW QUALITY PROTEIN: hypothetical protein ACHAW6_006625 [Cyclotella cf. meneghiniana]
MVMTSVNSHQASGTTNGTRSHSLLATLALKQLASFIPNISQRYCRTTIPYPLTGQANSSVESL